MKKKVLALSILMASLTAQADNYSYLAFQTSDGIVTTVSVESLNITMSNGQLVATNSDGSYTFTLTELDKMYFTSEGATAISDLDIMNHENCTDIYDMQGRKVSRDQMRRGVYIVKTNYGTYKINVK